MARNVALVYFMKEILEKINITDVKEIPGELPTYSFFYMSDNIKVRGFIIFPKNVSEKNPTVFLNRGGTAEFGMITPQNITHWNYFSKAGYISVLTQYRGCDGGGGVDRMGGDDIFDIVNLHGIIKEIPIIDQNRIGMWGASRGAMMTFQVVARVPWVKAMIIVSPLVDEVHMAEWRENWKQHQIEVYGGSYPEQLKRSPLRWAEYIPKIPSIFFVGMKDDKIDPYKAIEMAEKINAEKVIFPESGHLISPQTITQSVQFFDKHL